MDIPISLEVLGATQEDLKALGAKLPSAGPLTIKPVKDSLMFWKWKGFEISGLTVPDSTNVKADYWPLDEAGRKALTELLQAWQKICQKRIFTLYSAPGGELPRRESEIQLDELLGMIGEGQLGHRVKYRVRELPPKIVDDTAPPAEGGDAKS